MNQHGDRADRPQPGREDAAEAHATIDIRPERRIGRIEKNIYGHFLESAFFGNIEGGVFDEGSPLSDEGPGAGAGLRRDVIDLCRKIAPPVVRWPGGNFTSPYWWEDGVGPRDARPRRLELAWGSEETNRFGTDEFLTWCEQVGADAYLAHNCRSVDDAVRWVEYANHRGDTDYARARARNGHPEPYGVRYWGLGNEVYGRWQMGHRPAERYAADAREHASFMRAVDPGARFVAVGQDHEAWTRAVLASVGGMSDYLSLHLYGASTHLYTADRAAEFDAVAAQSLFVEQRVQRYARMVADLSAACGVENPPSIALDEWNIRHLEPTAWPEPQPSADGGVAPRHEAAADDSAGAHGGQGRKFRVNRWSPRTLADALFHAGVFHALHRASGLAAAPRMANTVNLLNANGVIVARDGGAVGSATFHVWDLYRNHAGPVAVAADVRAPSRLADVRQGDHRDPTDGFATVPTAVPDLDVSATTTEDGASLRVAVINRNRTQPVIARLSRDGRSEGLPPTATVRDIGAGSDDPFAGNDLETPDRVALTERGTVELPDGRYAFPPHSVTMLEFALRP